ncbi:SDR family NAD(P)-dependent oxidoreductase [uncultured Aquabacterium sp.]|jgi:NAD(P)-dependent dehydrogenase (short-subunit alcohol dehydrogenase family)|uniref:SDR family NAD(P)-dependent oxidoreductase n=1 Tax=uncultured Aquabacterium sp. TaxID=158753 RepID=UPI002624C1D5|nr:SDR family NAD(P)-dependent oxidoreductase [uncultured Aquabacterium sp.]
MNQTASSASEPTDTVRLDGRVAIVTGAGAGLGRAHALLLAARGARVVVNDLRDPQPVVEAIRAAGGEAIGHIGSVTDEAAVQAMAELAMATWGRIDILVNNAGILRDKSFSKMTVEDFRTVVDVHLMGAVLCTKAVWEVMKGQQHGRIVFTTSSSGLFGNFGQSNYGAAKMALVGLMQTLSLEGEKYNVRVNCLAPTAATSMTEGILPPQALALLTPESVSPGLLFLVSEQAPTRAILNAGAGVFATTHVVLGEPHLVGSAPDAAERVAAAWPQISDRAAAIEPIGGMQQSAREMALVLSSGAAG